MRSWGATTAARRCWSWRRRARPVAVAGSWRSSCWRPCWRPSIWAATPWNGGRGWISPGRRTPHGTRPPPGREPPPPGAGGPASAAVLLQRRLDSLAVSLDRFRERRGDFVRGRLGCRGLTRGFEEMEGRFDAASRAYGRLEAGGGDGAAGTGPFRERYRRLSAAVDSLSRLFVASGCAEEDVATAGSTG